MILKATLPTIFSFMVLSRYCDMETLMLTLILSIVHMSISNMFARAMSHENLLGYPVWSYYASIFQQLCVLPPIAGMLLWRESCSMHKWLFSIEVVPEKYSARSDLLKTLSLVTTASAMIKDYWAYVHINKLGFLIHHITTVFACGHCLAMPIYSGAVILVGIFAEFTSLFYNIRVLDPSPRNAALHVGFMGLSNVLAILLCRHMWVHVTETIYLPWKLGFTVIVFILSILRFAGFIVDV